MEQDASLLMDDERLAILVYCKQQCPLAILCKGPYLQVQHRGRCLALACFFHSSGSSTFLQYLFEALER